MDDDQIDDWNEIVAALKRAQENLIELALELGITPEANDEIKRIMEKK